MDEKGIKRVLLPDIIININIFLTIFLQFFAITHEKVTGKGPSLREGRPSILVKPHFMRVGLHFVKVDPQS